MGQKVSPIGMRVGVIRDWQSRWYADDKEFGTLLLEDVKIRELVEAYYVKLSNEAVDKRKADPQISRIEIERTKGRMTVIIRTAHPGVVIGQDGKSIEGLKKQVSKIASAKNVQINVVEVANPNLDARLVARWIANELEGRKSFRATQKKAIQNTMRAGAKLLYLDVLVELIWHVLKDIQKELFLYIHFVVILTMLGKKRRLNMVV